MKMLENLSLKKALCFHCLLFGCQIIIDDAICSIVQFHHT
jgi:hypothetical protein